jgi:hypothetical protein
MTPSLPLRAAAIFLLLLASAPGAQTLRPARPLDIARVKGDLHMISA